MFDQLLNVSQIKLASKTTDLGGKRSGQKCDVRTSELINEFDITAIKLIQQHAECSFALYQGPPQSALAWVPLALELC